MQILMISRLFYPHIGGVERHLLSLNNSLLKKGHKVSVITEKYQNSLPGNQTFFGTKIYRIAYPHIKALGIIILWIKLIKYINLIKNADVVHVHDVFVWMLPFKLLFPRKHIFITFHGYESYPIKLSSMILRAIAERNCSGSICVGEFMKKWYGTKPDMVVYGAVDTSNFKPSSDQYRYNAIFTSRLDSQTGIVDYVKAVKELSKNNQKLSLVILGDGPLRTRVGRYGVIKGFVDDPEHYYMKSQMAFVSRYLAILEALACRMPVFAVFDNHLKEDYLRLSPFSRWITIANDYTEITEKVSLFKKNPGCFKKAIDMGFVWSSNMTWKRMTQNYLKLWSRN